MSGNRDHGNRGASNRDSGLLTYLLTFLNDVTQSSVDVAEILDYVTE